MFNFFKRDKKDITTNQPSFELELTGAVLAYEIARSDGDISKDELSILMSEIEKIATITITNCIPRNWQLDRIQFHGYHIF